MNAELKSINPANDEVLGAVTITEPNTIDQMVVKSHKVQKKWQALAIEQRIKCMDDLYDILCKNKQNIIKATSNEMGMPITLATTITEAGLAEFKWNLKNVKDAVADVVLYQDEHEKNLKQHCPYGVVACILPWNYPLPNFARSPCQALLVGNSVIIKYSEEIPLFAKMMQDLIAESDLPDDVVQFVYGGPEVGEYLTDQQIDYISFTGSSKTGQHLYQKAAQKLIPVELELGGSSPGVVFGDIECDDNLIEAIATRRFANSGQFCSGLKRLIVHKSKVEELTSKLVAYANNMKVGDPNDSNTNLGPLVAKRQIVALEAQLQDATDKGATVLCGGNRLQNNVGAYFAPTILADINTDMQVWQSEVFGPVLPIITFEKYADAIKLANDTKYGLSAFVFTNDKELAMRAMNDIDAGSIQQNICDYQRPPNPFGGFKASGIGRQKGVSGFHHLTQIKVIAHEV